MILILSLIALVFLLVGPVWAASTGTINVTVSPKLISLSVSPTSYDYGALGYNDSTETTITFSVQNDGNVAEDFDIEGFDTADWSLGATAGTDAYVHEWKEASGSYTPLVEAPSSAAAATAVASGNSESFKFQLHTPTDSLVTDDQNPNVKFTASES